MEMNEMERGVFILGIVAELERDAVIAGRLDPVKAQEIVDRALTDFAAARAVRAGVEIGVGGAGGQTSETAKINVDGTWKLSDNP